MPLDAQPDRITVRTLVHIAREAVTNAVKHGHPTSVEVVLEFRDEWLLKIGDRGRGFAAELNPPASAWKSMTEHAEALGGLLRVRSVPGEGTIVEAVLP